LIKISGRHTYLGTVCRVTAKEQHLQFSKAPILSNFGELPFGEIPEPLKYTRPFRKYNRIGYLWDFFS
jgi:hypothetical protein